MQWKFNWLKAGIHDNEPPEHINCKERDNSTVEGDLHTVRPEPISGSELTNRLVAYRIRQKTEDKQK
jgi:hypothetical protein